MNKSQGATTGAAMILAAGAFLRPAQTTLAPSITHTAPAQVSSLGKSAASNEKIDGPWRASCQYWAPARVHQTVADDKPATISLNISGSENNLTSHLQVATSEESSRCDPNTDAWGIPARLPDGEAPEITAIIATVPDPERGHLGLDFDRTIDALMQAASDNGYVSSYFWLPWRSTGEHETGAASAEAFNAEEQRDRLDQPGLVVLKYGGVDPQRHGLSFRRVIYLFLVAATPTQGVNGKQLQRAFEDEAYLLTKPHTTLSMRDNPDGIPHLATAAGELVMQQKRSFRRQHAAPDLREADPHAPDARVPDPPGPDPRAPERPQPIASTSEPTAQMDLLLFNYSGSAASLRAGIQAALADAGSLHPMLSTHKIRTVSVAGATSTELVGTLLNERFGKTDIRFHSFAPSASVEQAEVTNLFQDEWGSCDRIAFLAEDGTVFGSSASNAFSANAAPPSAAKSMTNAAPNMQEQAGGQKPETDSAPKRILSPCKYDKPLVLNFPRDISLLRNATAREGEKNKEQTDASVSPYLRFSLGDSNREDSVPHFSPDDTPLSQEAQLMAIGRRLVHAHVRTIAISASNILDGIFLAQFLHRACPDARLVFVGGGDLIIEREIENAQYIGGITLSPYTLVNLDHDFYTPRHMRAFASAQSEAFYNAASYTFWDRDNRIPWLAGYPLYGHSVLRPLLWAATVGRDGYYPLGLLDQCSSYAETTLPDITVPQGAEKAAAAACTRQDKADPPEPFEPGVRVYPSMFWFVLCVIVILLCTGHAAVLFTANFWSPLTRDLAIESGDMPRRRSVYVNIATAMLFCMAFVVAYPLLPVSRVSVWSFNAILWASLALLAATVSLVATAVRTLPHIGAGAEERETPERRDRCSDRPRRDPPHRKNFYTLLHVIALVTLIAVPALWAVICETDVTIGTHTFAGLFFSYRCLHPEVGVSPLIPIVFLLFGWYLWGLFQTLRLRFSVNSRPQLPCRVHSHAAYPLYVAEEDLSRCDTSQSPCLYRNITCLLITREIVRRFFLSPGPGVDAVLVLGYFALFLIAVVFVHVQSLDHFLWKVGFWPTYYEFLIRALLFPLMMVALTGWVRVLFVWNSLRRGLLEPLERLPIRFAFTRLKGVGWITMLRQGGLEEYWRDMARSTEAMRQIIHTDDLRAALNRSDTSSWIELEATNTSLGGYIGDLRRLVGDATPRRRREDSTLRPGKRDWLVGEDIPGRLYCDELDLMSAIERSYARFSELLLERLLIPYWDRERTGFVEGEPVEMMPIKARRGTKESEEALELHTAPHSEEGKHIGYAEEFVALRYVSVIRAVLVNLRYTMIFVSSAFVLAILAWNSYPFRPQTWVDWMFTATLAVIGSGIVWVFAQMYRDPILSRITDTSANELGIEFYVRLATFGALPLLTWLASQFPVIGNGLFHFLKPGLEVVK